MIDPLVSLSFALHSSKGVYALLLGSGVSRSAGIPTGWEITQDLMEKLARAENADCEPENWYRSKFGGDPDYSKLLEKLAGTPAERQQHLRKFFEPSEEEREKGLKCPQAAHKAIAELVQQGIIKIILTTNFDRLIETALQEAGISPMIISSPDAAEGAMPLAHSECTVIKLHGDYRDIRILNTEAELRRYDKRLNSLLAQVFDEYGLIVCGWSADWDLALIKALERAKSRRFSTYIAVRDPSDGLNRLATLRKAEIIRIREADLSFKDLVEKVTSLKAIPQFHPLSRDLAVATLKRYISKSDRRIDLHDFVMKETEYIHKENRESRFPTGGIYPDKQAIIDRISSMEALIEILLAIVINGCFWGGSDVKNIWMRVLQRIGNSDSLENSPSGGFYDSWRTLSMYPASVLFYSMSISYVETEKYDLMYELWTKTIIRKPNKDEKAVVALQPNRLLELRSQRECFGNSYTPLNGHVYNVVRPFFAGLILENEKYDENWDRVEYLMAMVNIDMGVAGSARPGRFAWRDELYGKTICTKVKEELELRKDRWEPLLGGFFEGSVERAYLAKAGVDSMVRELGWVSGFR